MTDMEPFAQFLEKSYATVGAFDADIVYIYSDLRHFAQFVDEMGGRDAFCRGLVQPLIDRRQTILTTTFTYTTSGQFDVLTTPTRLGALNAWILRQAQVERSEHPLFSYAALGPKSRFVRNIGKSAFGHDSVFDRLRGMRAAFLHLGRPVKMGNTLLHHIEQVCGATYRIHKAFDTEVFRGTEYVGRDYTAFLRRRDVPGETFCFSFRKAAQAMQETGMIKTVGDDADFSAISCYRVDQAFAFLTELFYQDQRLFIESNFMQY